MFKTEDIQGKRVLIRADVDVAVKNGQVEDDFRLQKLLPTLTKCLSHAHQICLIGHMGRPSSADPELSLKPVSDRLKVLINQEIKLLNSGFAPGEWWKGEDKVILLENLRLDKREEGLDLEFGEGLATNADIYIYEAFAAYRPCTSLSLVPKLLPTFTGLQFDEEVSTLSSLLQNPKRPTLLIGSGAKPEKKELFEAISSNFDLHFYGGLFANPADLTSDGLDINKVATKTLLELIDKANTVVLNGPLGRFEDGIHHQATKEVLEKLKNSPKTVILGGGDTLNAVKELGFHYTQYGFVSTGGGGMLEFLRTGTHPLLDMLK